jgi:hypothetical protein
MCTDGCRGVKNWRYESAGAAQQAFNRQGLSSIIVFDRQKPFGIVLRLMGLKVRYLQESSIARAGRIYTTNITLLVRVL